MSLSHSRSTNKQNKQKRVPARGSHGTEPQQQQQPDEKLSSSSTTAAGTDCVVSWSSLSLILQVSELPPTLVGEMDVCVYTNVILASSTSNNELHEVNIIYVFLQLINFASTHGFIVRDCIIIYLQ
jgi:hypothetical protein